MWYLSPYYNRLLFMSISCCSKLSVMNLCIWNSATVVALIIQTVNNND